MLAAAALAFGALAGATAPVFPVTDLGLLPLPGASIGGVTAVNDSGRAVGYSYGATQAHAFTWTKAGGMTDLGTLGGLFGDASDINDGGTNRRRGQPAGRQ